MSKSTDQAGATSMVTCSFCGVEFDNDRNGKRGPRPKYCSDECRRSAWKRVSYVSRCKHCGVEFHPLRSKGKSQRYCSVECYEAATDRQPLVDSTCKECGKSFTARKDRTTFCSWECAFEHRQKRCPTCGTSLRGSTATYCSEECRPERELHTFQCVVCGSDFQSHWQRLSCSDGCEKRRMRRYMRRYSRKRYAEARPDRTYECKECGSVFTTSYDPLIGRGDRRRVYCSDECQKRHLGRIAKATRRARIRGADDYEYFDPLEIFERDGWQCQLCGCKTPKRLRGSIEDCAPELDHIVPIARGGAHIRTNVQCLCRKCNQAKGARTLGQLRLTI